jgi:subtilisin family serine protease
MWSGLLPGAELYAAAVYERRDDRISASAVAIATALDWLVANRVTVVNLSLSGQPNRLLERAARRAAERGTILVAAAGNGGPEAEPAYPAAYPEVIAVTAVDERGQAFAGANRGDYIAFAAPGVRVWAPGGGPFGQYLTGTSYATPFAAAVIALELMNGKPAEPAGLSRELAAHSDHLGAPGRNPVYGYGLVKAARACAAPTALAQQPTSAVAQQPATGTLIPLPIPVQ